MCSTTIPYLWSLVHSWYQWVSQDLVTGLFRATTNKLLIDGVLHKHPGASQTALALVEEETTVGLFHCILHYNTHTHSCYVHEHLLVYTYTNSTHPKNIYTETHTDKHTYAQTHTHTHTLTLTVTVCEDNIGVLAAQLQSDTFQVAVTSSLLDEFPYLETTTGKNAQFTT